MFDTKPPTKDISLRAVHLGAPRCTARISMHIQQIAMKAKCAADTTVNGQTTCERRSEEVACSRLRPCIRALIRAKCKESRVQVKRRRGSLQTCAHARDPRASHSNADTRLRARARAGNMCMWNFWLGGRCASQHAVGALVNMVARTCGLSVGNSGR